MGETAVFLTNIPAPYREQVHTIINDELELNYHVIYCSKIEPNRAWNIESGMYSKYYLKSKSVEMNGKVIYLWSNIIKLLNSLNPNVVILGGLSLPMLTAFLWAKAKGRKIISFSDFTLDAEENQGLTIVHKLIRKLVFNQSNAFVGASQKTFHYFKYYNKSHFQFYQSQLCANNELYRSYFKTVESREYDLLLCGQMIERKMFGFSIDVIADLLNRAPNIKVCVVGDGPMRKQVLDRLASLGVSFEYLGYLKQEALPLVYSNVKIFLFPSKGDPWGVVANEALAAGTPVITTKNTGVANELVINNFNGLVLASEIRLWSHAIFMLLNNSLELESMSLNALRSVSNYTYKNAAKGIINAINSQV